MVKNVEGCWDGSAKSVETRCSIYASRERMYENNIHSWEYLTLYHPLHERYTSGRIQPLTAHAVSSAIFIIYAYAMQVRPLSISTAIAKLMDRCGPRLSVRE